MDELPTLVFFLNIDDGMPTNYELLLPIYSSISCVRLPVDYRNSRLKRDITD